MTWASPSTTRRYPPNGYSCCDEYQTSFNLGMFRDATQQTYEEFVAKLEEGGLSKYMEEWNRQRSEFLAAKEFLRTSAKRRMAANSHPPFLKMAPNPPSGAFWALSGAFFGQPLYKRRFDNYNQRRRSARLRIIRKRFINFVTFPVFFRV